ncbi:hypothetical protein BDA96_08G055000 [Sorghum bicolor]|uniref:Uncharacterized protein n=1 Tax=Sorghum bicolor TaxID=4558 RepID=A0A921QG64_SORBI|nr:hypothetical protein BDA96_08G055000 [Sorghum bicolor]
MVISSASLLVLASAAASTIRPPTPPARLRGWWTGVGGYSSFTCHRWGGNWSTSMARGGGCCWWWLWLWLWLFRCRWSCSTWLCLLACSDGSKVGLAIGRYSGSSRPCLYRTPHALHSVLRPSGPSRHCGVDDDPQCRHCFADFRGRHGFLDESAEAAAFFFFFFFLTRYTAGAGAGAGGGAGASAGSVLGRGGGFPRFRGFFLTSAPAALSRTPQALQSVPCPIGPDLHCGVTAAPHCRHNLALFAGLSSTAAGVDDGELEGPPARRLGTEAETAARLAPDGGVQAGNGDGQGEPRRREREHVAGAPSDSPSPPPVAMADADRRVLGSNPGGCAA